MKLYLVKITKATKPMSWYARDIGALFYCEESRPYADEGTYFLALRRLNDPTYMGQHYISKCDCEVLEEFEGRAVPTNTVDIVREQS